MTKTPAALLCVWIAASLSVGAAGQASAKRPTATAGTQQKASAQLIDAGRTRFAAQCGFCHGRDAAGGETGPDLTRSALVAEDVRGSKIGPLVRAGRIDKGMPAFTLSDADLAGIVAFLHDAASKASSLNGGRRGVDPADLATGDAEAGKRYFNGAGGCAACHDPSGEFATVAKRYQGLALLQRMLNPRSGRGGGGGGENQGRAPNAPARPMVTVTPESGPPVTGHLAYRDEFTIALIDADGWNHSWPADRVKIAVQDPLQAHVDQLPKYTDADMHDVLAYLRALALAK
jgi:cytochrome c oxidase cbb3-type subunit 3